MAERHDGVGEEQVFAWHIFESPDQAQRPAGIKINLCADARQKLLVGIAVFLLEHLVCVQKKMAHAEHGEKWHEGQ